VICAPAKTLGEYPTSLILRCDPGASAGGASKDAVSLVQDQYDRVMQAWVYMLRCNDGSYYVGSARGDELDRRIGEHDAGIHPGYTARRRPVVLVWSERFDRITDAIAAERQLKGWSRAKKEALARGDWSAVRALARRRGGTRSRTSS
jgi:putative endonuclease